MANTRNGICAAILAAGQSSRFGTDDKLSQVLGEAMLGLHIGKTLSQQQFEHSVVITSSADHPCAKGWQSNGFKVLVNERAREGMGTSVALAAKHAAELSAEALLVCLADMPFVPASHIRHLVEACEKCGDTGLVASSDGHTSSPPAIFGAQHFQELMQMEGPKGARDLIAKAELITIAPALLGDIDTVEQLEQAQAGLLSNTN